MSKPMTKTQLVAALAETMGSDKKTANAALDAIAAVVAREVAAGGAVTLPGLGKVVCRARPERQVRNPATGETRAFCRCHISSRPMAEHRAAPQRAALFLGCRRWTCAPF